MNQMMKRLAVVRCALHIASSFVGVNHTLDGVLLAF
jgi:hypothetical protein